MNLGAVLPEGRILAFDLGRKRLGAAVCDELHLIARPLTVIRMRQFEELWPEIEKLISDYQPVLIIVGNPLHMNGCAGLSAQRSAEFAAAIQARVSVAVILRDERLTTWEAEQRLIEQGICLAERRRRIDAEAAAIILEDFLKDAKTGVKAADDAGREE